jgi:4-hydroxybenzoyl-CoA thioesterase
VFVFSRPVRFEEVDAARIVFFARYFNICHDAMEAFFGPLPGGYAGLIVGRKIGFPAVRAECDFKSSLRYGDVVRAEVTVPHVGKTSVTFAYRLVRESDGVEVGIAKQTCVVCELETMKKTPIPDDVRALLVAHAT